MAVLSGIVKSGPNDRGAVNSPQGLRQDGNLNAMVGAGSPPYLEMSRQGLGWQVQDTAALAALVVRPSTVAGLTLWNGEPVGGKSYVIDAVNAFNLVTTAAVSGWSIWACIHPIGMTKPTADITAINSMSGKASYGGFAIVDTGATVVDNGWFPVNTGVNTGGVTTAPSFAQVALIEGRFVIPPTAAISIQVVATIVGLTFTHGFRWYEQQVDVNP